MKRREFTGKNEPKQEPAVKCKITVIKKILFSDLCEKYAKEKVDICPRFDEGQEIFVTSAYNFDVAMCSQAVDWILQSQKADGSWGYSSNYSTAEETAYCIQALKVWKTHGGKIPKGRIEMAAAWLEENSSPPYPSLWIGKVLYCPEYVVKSAILSAIELSRN